MRRDVFSGEAAMCPPDRMARTLEQRTAGSAPRWQLDRAYFALSLACALVATISANAEPRTIEDCEKIQAADAYNQCLASFGPVAHEHGVTADPEGSGSHGGHAAADPEASRPRGSHYQRHASRPRHADPWVNMRHTGRHRIEFSVK